MPPLPCPFQVLATQPTLTPRSRPSSDTISLWLRGRNNFMLSVKMARKEEQYNFNILFIKRFWRLHRVFFPGLLSVNTGVFALLLLTSGLEQFLAYRVGIISGKFFNVLGSKNLEEFKSLCILSILIVIGISFTISARVLTTKTLQVGWRQTLCQMLHHLYLSNSNYYRLNVLDGSIDNPDQRISSDVSSLVESYSSIISSLVVTPFTIAYYTWDAYTRAGWIGPTGMYILFVVSTIVNKFLMKPVVQITVERERREGDFRFKHVQVRCNAESLAFHGSASSELTKVNNKLSEVCGVQQKLFNRNFIIDISVNMFAYIGAIASYLVISVPIFAGVYDSLSGAEISQMISENAFVCIYLVSQLTKLVSITGTVASMAGSTHRVCELVERLVKFGKEADLSPSSCTTPPPSSSHQSFDPQSTSSSHPPYSEPSAIETVSIIDTTEEIGDTQQISTLKETLETPIINNALERREMNDVLLEFLWFSLFSPRTASSEPELLIRNLNLKLIKGRNLLIMGPSSSGKSSLLRAVRGLWKPAQGEVIINRELEHRFFFLPQKPFFTNGTLREQINYPLLVVPSLVDRLQDKNILNLLQITGLTGLLDRCGGLDTEPNWAWYDVLSPGEQQRLAFTRLLYHDPVLAVLDEATSAISQDVESRLYECCLERKITLLSVGHRESLKKFHHQVVNLSGENGEWKMEDIVSDKPGDKGASNLNRVWPSAPTLL
uniref:ABCD4 n=1 Tax=Eurytemora affinis TaxID=88015 RepID=A0A8B0MC96_EURAF|nr:ABCD4 [Eurytemora affinis]